MWHSMSPILKTVFVCLCLILSIYTVADGKIGPTERVWRSMNGSTNFNLSEVTNICESFYLEYIKAVNNFTHCELRNAQPFRLCEKCIEHYEVASSIYKDLLTYSFLEDCRRQYLESDSIQIIPTIQSNMDTIWMNSACDGYAENVTLNATTGCVTYSVYPDVAHFLILYHNLTLCMNQTDKIDEGYVATNASVCNACQDMYSKLNSYFNHMSPHISSSGDKDDSSNSNIICMDVVDRMNHTRFYWSEKLNCSKRSSDVTPVVAITCIVAITPMIFYTLSRITGREGFKKLYQQKRLLLSQTLNVSSSQENSEDGPIQRLGQRLSSLTR